MDRFAIQRGGKRDGVTVFDHLQRLPGVGFADRWIEGISDSLFPWELERAGGGAREKVINRDGRDEGARDCLYEIVQERSFW